VNTLDMGRMAEEREARRREQARERQRRYRISHPGQIAESRRRYRAAHLSEQLEREHQYRAAHREERREINRRWRVANPGKSATKRPCADCGRPCMGHVADPRCRVCATRYYRGDKKGSFKGDSITSLYRQVRNGGRQCSEHRLVWEAAHGPLPKGWVVHHRNGDGLDNRLENLQAMPHGEHDRLHRSRRAAGERLMADARR